MTGNRRPTVSVIVPYYNGARYIREAIQSILAQSYPGIEIIVVDDASPDPGQKQFIRQLSEEMGFKLLVHTANQGIGRTMADAVEASRGEFIAELSQDDLYKPEKIQKQIQELTGKKLDAVYAAGDQSESSNGRCQSRKISQTGDLIRSGKAADYLKLKNMANISIQGLLAKRSVFEQAIVPIWKDFLLDDWPVHIRLFDHYKVGYLEEPLWTRRKHGSNTSRNIWKWFGPQVEVVARMTPAPLRTKAIGRRLYSMANKLQRQKGASGQIIRLALAALMLMDAGEKSVRLSRLLVKTPLRERKIIIDHKGKLLADTLAADSVSRISDEADILQWDDLGKQIAGIASACPESERVSQIGKTFRQLASGIVQNGSREQANSAVQVALAAMMMTEDPREESEILSLLDARTSGSSRVLVASKTRELQACRSGLRALFNSVFALGWTGRGPFAEEDQ